MYARIVLFTLGSGMRSTAEQIADELIPAIKAQQGCDAALSLIDDEAGEYGLVALWASKEDAEVAAKAMGPRLRSALEGVATEPPTIRLMEVHEPAA